jgi:hypothetical protein
VQEAAIKGQFQSFKGTATKNMSSDQLVCQDLLYRVSAKNLLDKSVKVKLSFVPL